MEYSYNHSIREYICENCQTDHKADVGFGAKDSVPVHDEMRGTSQISSLVMERVLQNVVYRGLVKYRWMQKIE
jgi:hypothetical protein